MKKAYSSSLENALLWTIRVGTALLLVTPFIVSSSLFFPYVTGKNFFFRAVVAIIFGAWVFLAIGNKRYRPQWRPLSIAVSIFIGFLGLATLFGADPYHSFWSSFERMEGYVTHLHLLALFMVLAHTFKKKEEWLYILYGTLAMSTVIACYGLLEKAGIVQTVGSQGRPFATFGNPIYLAVYLMFHLFFLAGFAYKARENWIRLLAIALMILHLSAFMVTESRGAFVGLVVGIGVAALLTLLTTRQRNYRFIALGAIGLLLVIGVLVFAFPDSTIVKSSKTLRRIALISFEDVSKEPRYLIWQMGVEAFKERPILGWGPENFVIPYGKYYDPNLYGNEAWFDRVHNMFLEWLIAGGVLTFAAYISIFAIAASILWKLGRTGVLDPVIAFMGIGVGAAYLAQDFFVFDVITSYLFLIFGLAFLHSRTLKDQGADEWRGASSIQASSLQFASGVGIVITVLLVLYFVNVRPLGAARGIIAALQSPGTNPSPDTIINAFKKPIEAQTFGSTEAREQLANMVIQGLTQGKSVPREYVKLVDFAVQEIKKEGEEHPLVPKNPLFLGKLETLKIEMTGTANTKPAQEAYDKALALAPNYIQTYVGLGEFYLISGEPAKIPKISDTIFHLPTYPNRRALTLNPAVSMLLLSGNYKEARLMLDEYKQSPGSTPLELVLGADHVRLFIGRAFYSKGDKAERLRFFEYIKEPFEKPVEPVNPEILPNILVAIAQSHAELGNKAAARASAERAAELNPTLTSQVEAFLKTL